MILYKTCDEFSEGRLVTDGCSLDVELVGAAGMSWCSKNLSFFNCLFFIAVLCNTGMHKALSDLVNSVEVVNNWFFDVLCTR